MLLRIALFLLVFLLIPNSAKSQQETKPTKALVGQIFSIRSRMEKDPRIRLGEEIYKGNSRVHVYLVTSDQTLPYMVSLGWLRITDCVIPEKPVKKSLFSFRKKEPVPVSQEEKNLFNPSSSKVKGLNVVDENNFVLPALTESPLENSRKLDIINLAGFDSLIENDQRKAEELFKTACEQEDGNVAKFLNNYAALLALRGEFSEASKYFDKAIKEYPEYINAITNRGLLELAIGAPQVALKDFDKALSLNKKLHPALVGKTRALLETGAKKEALELASDLKQRFPADWQTMMLLADCELGNEMYKEAQQTLSRLSVLAPSNSDLLIKLAHAEEKNGDLDSAMKHARKASLIGGSDPKTHVALAQYLMDNRDPNAASLQLQRAMQLNPDKNLRKRAMGNLLNILVSQQKLDQAFEFASKWCKEYAKDYFCHFNRAWIASQMEGTEYRDIAIEEYKEAIKQNKNLSSARYNLALLLINKKSYPEALKQLKAFVQANPDDKDSKHARELISKIQGTGK